MVENLSALFRLSGRINSMPVGKRIFISHSDLQLISGGFDRLRAHILGSDHDDLWKFSTTARGYYITRLAA